VCSLEGLTFSNTIGQLRTFNGAQYAHYPYWRSWLGYS
jgi:hypothetical protein